VGDDLHSLLVGLLHSLSSSNLRLRDLHYDLIHLNTYQLAQEWEPRMGEAGIPRHVYNLEIRGLYEQWQHRPNLITPTTSHHFWIEKKRPVAFGLPSGNLT